MLPAVDIPDPILVIGDSQAFFLQRPLKKQCAELGVTVHKQARPGSTALSWASSVWLDRLLKKYSPELVVIAAGTNDAGGTIARYRFSENMRRIVDRVHSTGALLYWVIPPKSKVREDHIMRQVRREQSIDRVFDSTCLDLTPGPDGVHLTLKDSRRWASSVLDFIEGKGRPCPVVLPSDFFMADGRVGIQLHF